MKDVWKKYRLQIALLVYFIIIFLLFIFAVNPLISDIKENSDEIEKSKIDAEISQERIAKLPEMKDGYAAYEEEKKNLGVVLGQNNSIDFIKKIELLAEETGNKISLSIETNPDTTRSAKSTKVEKGDADDIKSGLPENKYLLMKIVLEGTYDNFVRFLYKLENMEYYVSVISFNMSKESVESEERARTIDEKNTITKKDILISELEIAIYTK